MNRYAADTACATPDAMSAHGSTLTGRIENYWSRRAESYGEIRRHELACEKKSLWLAEIMPHLPEARPLRILDVGTGAGFFAILLAEQGHRVCGVDMTQAMLDEGAQVLYVDELCDMRVASSLSEQTGAQIRVFYTCHNVTQEQMDAGVTYLDLMRENLKGISE